MYAKSKYNCKGEFCAAQLKVESQLSLSWKFPSGGSRISPRWGHQPSRGVPTYDFAKNCMKFKEFGPRGGGGGAYLEPPLDPPLFPLLMVFQLPHHFDSNIVSI